jgi:hypothetical protein
MIKEASATTQPRHVVRKESGQMRGRELQRGTWGWDMGKKND